MGQKGETKGRHIHPKPLGPPQSREEALLLSLCGPSPVQRQLAKLTAKGAVTLVSNDQTLLQAAFPNPYDVSHYKTREKTQPCGQGMREEKLLLQE